MHLSADHKRLAEEGFGIGISMLFVQHKPHIAKQEGRVSAYRSSRLLHNAKRFTERLLSPVEIALPQLHPADVVERHGNIAVLVAHYPFYDTERGTQERVGRSIVAPGIGDERQVFRASDTAG